MQYRYEVRPSFHLPKQELVLPPIEPYQNEAVGQAIVRLVEQTGRASQFLEILPLPHLWRADFGENGSVYLKDFLQKSHYMTQPTESHVVYAVDMDEAQQVMGWTFSVKHSSARDNLPELPFVGESRTRTGFQKRGFGLRRLIVLNELCRQIYGEPLGSGVFVDSSPDSPARKVWQRLFEAKLAVRDGDGYRFKFPTDE